MWNQMTYNFTRVWVKKGAPPFRKHFIHTKTDATSTVARVTNRAYYYTNAIRGLAFMCTVVRYYVTPSPPPLSGHDPLDPQGKSWLKRPGAANP